MFMTRYNPRNEMDRYLHRGWNLPGVFRELLESEAESETEVSAHRLPRTNVGEVDDAFVFTIEMPGIPKEDVDVSVEGDRLIVRGGSEKKSEKTEEQGLIRREFHATRYERSFRLGNDVDTDKVKAKMLDGVLTVTLPKKQEKVGRKVDVV